MSKPNNNKRLLFILAGLAFIFMVSSYLRNNNSKRNFDVALIKIDTSEVSKIIIHPKTEKNGAITITKDGNTWTVEQNKILDQINTSKMQQVLTELSQFKLERLVAKTKEKWKNYDVTDSLATKVEVFSNHGDPTTLYFGKTKYNTSRSQYNPNGFSASTYVRSNKNPAVYSIKSMIGNTLNGRFDSWRNAQVLKINKEQVIELHMQYPDETISWTKPDSVWLKNGTTSEDKKVVENYLSKLSNISWTKFYQGSEPITPPEYKLQIKTNNQEEILLKAYAQDNQFIIHSSQRPQVYFTSDSTGVFNRIFTM